MLQHKVLVLISLALFASLGVSDLASADVLRMGGTGAAIEMLKHMGAAFAAETGIKIEVVPSLGSSGGIHATAGGVLDIGVSGRHLKPDEARKGLTEIAAARTPFGVVTSNRNPSGMGSAEVAEAFKSDQAAWADGRPIRVILRPRGDSDTTLLGELFPGMSAALEAARRRPDVPMAATDQDNANLAEEVEGSFTGAAFTQIKMERRKKLRFVALDGVEPTLENFENGTYRYGKTFYFVFTEAKKPMVDRFLAFLRSPQGRVALRQTGTLTETAK